MASIVKRKSKYSVVYDYTDENGKRRQRWETFSTNAEAKKRKKQIEYEQDSGTFFIPTAKTLNDLLDEYMSIYGVNTWAMSTYESRRGLARNYITPIIGDMLLSDITPRMMDKYYRDLLSVKTVSVNNRKPTSEYLTPHTVREIHKSHLQGYHKEKPPEMDGFNYFRYSPRPEGGSLGYSSSSKLSNGPLRPERWSLVYSTFSSTPLSISFLACAEGSAE